MPLGASGTLSSTCQPQLGQLVRNYDRGVSLEEALVQEGMIYSPSVLRELTTTLQVNLGA